MEEFTAFPPETVKFLSGIDSNNDKAWFEANRDLYEAGFIAPARAFVETTGPRLAEISPGVRYEPKINGSISRINRDVRFSKDKRPGAALETAIAQVRAVGDYEIGGSTRKTKPRGYDADNKRAGFLLHEGLYAGTELPGSEAMRPGFPDRALNHFVATWPIGRWLLGEVAT